jgi:Fur family peroxide stress response transcriptional regulator
MDLETKPITDQLREHGIRPSYQRVRILSLLHQREGHPTADEIFQALILEIPTLSRATVYNTLHAFMKAGILQAIHTNGGEARYDAILASHGHFICDNCGSITNFPIDIDRYLSDELGRYEIKARNVYFNGICPECSAKD